MGSVGALTSESTLGNASTKLGGLLRAFYERIKMDNYFDKSDVIFFKIVSVTAVTVLALTWALT